MYLVSVGRASNSFDRSVPSFRKISGNSGARAEHRDAREGDDDDARDGRGEGSRTNDAARGGNASRATRAGMCVMEFQKRVGLIHPTKNFRHFPSH